MDARKDATFFIIVKLLAIVPSASSEFPAKST
jgi:hypothetical protein